MAYTKTQWVNNTTPINDTNLNKIEQGIYDNSLVVDAITNTLNPTDTETYKTAELTEGQITDVIGVNDILIKGQTSQDGTPTPSAPVDINVVSGSNVIDIQNSDTNFAKEPSLIGYNVNNDGLGVSSGYAVSQKIFVNNETKFYYGLNTAFSNVSDSTLRIGFFDENDNFLSRVLAANISTSPIRNVTIPNNTKYIMIGASNNASNGFWREIEKVYYGFSSTIVPHQGKELPLDLPVENLFDKNNYVAGQVYSNNTITANTPWGIFYLPCTSGETYIISGLKAYSGTQIVQCNSNKQFILNLVTRSTENTEYTVTATQNGYIGISFVWSASASKGSELDTINIKKAGTDPIELCKIGNYQDYFYKSGSKWYLHKEMTFETRTLEDNWETDTIPQSNPRKYVRNNNHTYIVPANNDTIVTAVCNYPLVSATNTSAGTASGVAIHPNGSFYISADVYNNLNSSPIKMYIPLITPVDTEITDTTLISQLEAIYNAPLYEQTNITQENNDLPMVLDITACKDNINGIKAFIRK